MANLISRQEALKAVGVNSWAGFRINALPSAQPEIKCIAKIMLTEEQVQEAFEKAKKEILVAQSEPKWIPVSERYPEPDERVLVTDGYCYYVWDCMSNRAEGYFWEDESGYYHNKYDVVAWMPLPEPYKGGDAE